MMQLFDEENEGFSSFFMLCWVRGYLDGEEGFGLLSCGCESHDPSCRFC